MKKIMLALAVLASSNVIYAEHTMETQMQKAKSEASADDRYNLGLAAGVNAPDGNRDATAEAGATFGYNPRPEVGLGADFSTSRFNDGDDADFERISAMARGAYNLGGDLPVLRDSYIGAAAGPIFLSRQNNPNQVEWALAPLVGFDIPLNQKLHDVISLGVNVKYLVTTNTPDSTITTGVVKYWF